MRLGGPRPETDVVLTPLMDLWRCVMYRDAKLDWNGLSWT